MNIFNILIKFAIFLLQIDYTFNCNFLINRVLKLLELFNVNFKLKILLLRTPCLKLEINEFGCYEAKVKGSEKSAVCQDLNQGHLWLEPPATTV